MVNGEKESFDQETIDLAKMYNFKIYSQKIKSFEGDPKNKILKGFILEDETKVEAEYIFVSLGMIVYNELALQLSAKVDSRGFVETDGKGKTSVDGLYVAGDLRANTKKQIYTAWDTAVDSADEINAILRRAKRNQLKK
jgi:thioredoxin reductase (NADPH)